jgi:hypothetical protein
MRIIPIEAFAVFAGFGELQPIVCRHLVPRPSVAFFIRQNVRLPGLLRLNVALVQLRQIRSFRVDICQILNNFPGRVVVPVQFVGFEVGDARCAVGRELREASLGTISVKVGHWLSPLHFISFLA